MVKRIEPIGDSMGLVIDRAVLDLLQIDRDTDLEITVTPDGQGLTIRPLPTDDHRARARASAERMMDIHGEALQKLAHS